MSTQFNCQKHFYFKLFKFGQTVLFQTIQFSISIVFVYKQLNVRTSSISVQFSISTHIGSIWPINRALSGASTLGQSGPGSNGNEGVLCIPQSSSIIRTSTSDCLVSYPGHSLGFFTPLQRCSRCILQPQMTEHLFWEGGHTRYVSSLVRGHYLKNSKWFYIEGTSNHFHDGKQQA